ncbi:MAG: patatin-like phospholipase family protein [Candidatus Sedimenticola sp. 20ELBAFRAG]
MAEDNYFRILSLSGGGVRGIFQAHLLKVIESKTGTPLHESFDLCAGTSIGSIIAAAISTGLPAENIVKVFENAVDKVFSKSSIRLYLRYRFRKGPLFDRTELDKIIKTTFGNTTIGDCKTGFLCTAGELSTFNHRVFSTASGSLDLDGVPLKDAVLASSSAPIFFSPYTPEGGEETFIDGGIWANSPTLLAVQFAHFSLGVPLENIRVVSIGTGIAPTGSHKSDLEKLKPRKQKTLINVLNMFSTSQVDYFDRAALALVGKYNYLSINPILSETINLHDRKKATKTLPAIATSEGLRAIESHAEFFTQKDKYDLRQRPSHNPDLANMVDISGLSKIMPKRKYYTQFRMRSGNIESYLLSAQKSIEMVSINLSTGLGFEKITRVFKAKLEEDPDFKVSVSLVDPGEDHLMKTVTSSISQEHFQKSPEEFSNDISAALSALAIARSELSPDCQSRFDLRVHNSLPQGSAIILDRGLESSVIQIETKPYKAPLTDSYAIEVVPTGKDGLYETFLNAYTSLVKDGHPWPQ